MRSTERVSSAERWTVRICAACGHDMDGATGCLGTSTQRHPPSPGVAVEVVPATALDEAAMRWSADLSAVARCLLRVMEQAVELMKENKIEDAFQVLLNALPDEDCRSVAQ